MACARSRVVLRRSRGHRLFWRRLPRNGNGLSSPQRARIGQVVRLDKLLLRHAMSARDRDDGFASFHGVALAARAFGGLCPWRHWRLPVLRGSCLRRYEKRRAGHDRTATKVVRPGNRLDGHAVPLGEGKDCFARRKRYHFSARRLRNGWAGGPWRSPAVCGRGISLVTPIVGVALRLAIVVALWLTIFVALRFAIVSAILLILRLLLVAIGTASRIPRRRRGRIAAWASAVVAALWGGAVAAAGRGGGGA